jgi:hypothetical protein
LKINTKKKEENNSIFSIIPNLTEMMNRKQNIQNTSISSTSSSSSSTYQCEEFTDDEIREQLEILGFKNVSTAKFNEFKRGLYIF